MNLIFSLLLGLCVGSFINALVWRIATGRGLGGRSMCPQCHKTLGARDLIPVVSFILLKGRCRQCHKKISWQYPTVEIVTAAAFVAVYWQVQQGLPMGQGIAQVVILSLLIALFSIDFEYGLLPDILTLPAIGIATLSRLIASQAPADAVVDMIFGATIGVAFFSIQWLASHGRWIGDGDIRLGALMGVLLGVPGVLLALVISYIFGAAVACVLLLKGGKTLRSTIALGPFLIAGTLVVYYGEGRILNFFGLL